MEPCTEMANAIINGQRLDKKVYEELGILATPVEPRLSLVDHSYWYTNKLHFE